jgi:hypothetical protein
MRAIRTLIYISRPDTFGLLNGHVLDNLSSIYHAYFDDGLSAFSTFHISEVI